MSAHPASNGATLTYEPLGRLWQMVKGTANTRFVYDGDALAAEYNGAGTMIARYVHGSNAAADDPLVWYTSAATSSKRWLHADRLGSVVAATNASGGSPSINSYDQLGRRASLARTGAGSTTYAYDSASRLATLAHDLNGTTSDHNLTFGYNPASQIISKTASNDNYAWTGAVAVNRNYTTNGLNQYTAAGPAAFTYDAKGNLTSDGSTAFTYDVENRLVAATGITVIVY